MLPALLLFWRDGCERTISMQDGGRSLRERWFDAMERM